MRRVSVPVALALLGVTSGAYAHPKLVSATPAPNATVAKPGRVELHFSEKLMPKFTGADLMMTGEAVKVASAAAVGADGRTLVITPKSPLRAGRYGVAWHAVSVDTHRVAGSYAFAVK
jgi:methionine-rich copper-binding protein CopC